MPKLLMALRKIAGKRREGGAANLEELRQLLAEGAPLEDADAEDHGWTTFMWAVYCGLDDAAALLEKAGADTSRYGDALLLRSIIQQRDAGLARRAIAQGANPNCKFCTGGTALSLATYHGQPEVVEALIQAGAHVPRDALNPLGEMDITDWKIDPIELETDYARVAEILLAHGASPDITAYDGQPLITTFPERYYPQIHRALAAALARQTRT